MTAIIIAAALLILGPLVVAWLIGGNNRMNDIFETELGEEEE